MAVSLAALDSAPRAIKKDLALTGGLVGNIYCVDGAGGSTPPQRVLALWLVS